MPVNLSVKNVPESIAEALRRRAERNHRSLQRELLHILEAAVGLASARSAIGEGAAPGDPQGSTQAREPISIDEIVALSRELFPGGTESSAAYLRELRDSR